METTTKERTPKEIKESIIQYIDYANDKQLKFIDEILNFPTFANKRDLSILSGLTDEQRAKIDTATPIDYFRRIEEIYPNFKNGNMVYDYNDPVIYGEMLNLNDLIVQRIVNLNK